MHFPSEGKTQFPDTMARMNKGFDESTEVIAACSFNSTHDLHQRSCYDYVEGEERNGRGGERESRGREEGREGGRNEGKII